MERKEGLMILLSYLRTKRCLTPCPRFLKGAKSGEKLIITVPTPLKSFKNSSCAEYWLFFYYFKTAADVSSGNKYPAHCTQKVITQDLIPQPPSHHHILMKRAVWMPNVPHLDETRKGLYTNQEDQEGVNEGDLREEEKGHDGGGTGGLTG